MEEHSIGVSIEILDYVPEELNSKTSGLVVERYPSFNGHWYLELQKESEIRFGPPYYNGVLRSSNGLSSTDFENRRFFSCASYGAVDFRWASPWNPSTQYLALPELLHTQNAPGASLARMSIFNAQEQLPIVTWDFPSVVSHKMWSRDGQYYLFRDAFTIYVYSNSGAHDIREIVRSSTPFCFLLNNFVVKLEYNGRIDLYDVSSCRHISSEWLSDETIKVRRALINERDNCIDALVLNLESNKHQPFRVRLAF